MLLLLDTYSKVPCCYNENAALETAFHLSPSPTGIYSEGPFLAETMSWRELGASRGTLVRLPRPGSRQCLDQSRAARPSSQRCAVERGIVLVSNSASAVELWKKLRRYL
eukprot:scaffold6004_cov229-Pinguiococcus_pyrenoidosus.AAC.3